MTEIRIDDAGDDLSDYMILEDIDCGEVYFRVYNPETQRFANIIVPIAELRAALDELEAEA